MVTNNFFRNLEKSFEKLKQTLEQICQEQKDVVVSSERCLMAVDEAIRKLRSHILQHQFGSMAEEILFFKNYKPRFISLYLYHLQILEIESEKPHAGKNNLKKFYQNKIRELNHYYDQHRDFYNYWKREATYLDHKYFVRNAYDLKMKLPSHLYSFDDRFMTFYDHQVAVFLANDNIMSFLTSQLHHLEDDRAKGNVFSGNLEWTAPKAALAELLYALHHSRCFNAGTSELSETIKIFEKLLNIDLNNFHKIVSDIRSRKNNRTRFLQYLQDNLNQIFLNSDE